MPKLDVSVNHRLSQEEALHRIRRLLSELKSQFGDKVTGLHEEWDGDIGKFSFSAMGFRVSGTLVIRASVVELRADLPFAATLFQGQIESVIRGRAEALLA